MFTKFMKYIRAEDIEGRDHLWSLYKDWMDAGKPAAKRLVVADRRVVDFVTEVCTVAVGQRVRKDALYDLYMLYSVDYRGSSVFARELRALLGNKVTDYRPSAMNAEGKRPRYWNGIGV